MSSLKRTVGALLALLAAGCAVTSAILVQPHNYMLDDSALLSPEASSSDAAALSPFHSDQASASEQVADRDIVSIIGEGLARLRQARAQQLAAEELANGQDSPATQHLSAEMAELLRGEQEAAAAAASQEQASLTAAASDSQATGSSESGERRAPIVEIETAASSAPASKSDVKQPTQWYNPKEAIPVLKISSMATPSKYKKVYFKSEKKLIDGAFHSVESADDKKMLHNARKPLAFGIQRRSSRGTTSPVAPPGILQDGVIEFLRKFRDVYIQTRPVAGSAAAAASAGSPLSSISPASAASQLASSFVAAAASSPLASIIAPPSGSSRPSNGALALASMLTGATSPRVSSSPSSSSSSSGSSQVAAAAANAAAQAASSAISNAAAAAATGSSSSASGAAKPPAQTVVTFWSKTFPTWVRKMLKQFRRHTLYKSKRHSQTAAAAAGHSVASQAASSAVASAVEAAANKASEAAAAAAANAVSSSH